MNYLDTLVTPVPKARLDEYRKHAELGAAVWLDHGALSYQEWIADDVPRGKLTSFPQALYLKDDEVVVVSLATYRSREHRDAVMAKVMADPRFADMKPDHLPFDARRMFWGGFTPLVLA